MSDFIGGIERVPLTAGLLSLIAVIQNYKAYIIAQRMFENELGKESDLDTYKECEKVFKKVDSEILAQYKLSKNTISFEKVLYFKITDEMNATPFSELPKKFVF